MSEQVEIFVELVLAVTDKACLCRVEGEDVWLPWSQIDEGSEIQSVGDSGIAYISKWLADEKGLEYE